MSHNPKNALKRKWAEVEANRKKLQQSKEIEDGEFKEKLSGLFSQIAKNREKFKKEEEALKARELREAREHEEAEKKELMKKRWTLAGVPEKFKTSQLKPLFLSPVTKQDKIDALNQLKIIEQIKELDVLNKNVVFYGFYGLGKSYFASYFTRKIIVDGNRAGFVSASDYIRFCKKDVVRAERFEQMEHLVLDEVGNGDIPDWDKVHLKDLLIRRDGNGLKTLITTNLSKSELRDYSRGTAQDRMLNMATVWVDFNVVPGCVSLRGRG